MSIKENKILVTGGTGFIGTNVCRELIAMGGYKATSFSNEDPNPMLADVTYLKGDVTNFNEVRDAIDDSEVVINLAALLGVFRSIENPDPYVDVNIKGTVNVLKAATAPGNQVRRFIQASSDAIYGEYPLVEGGISEDYYPLTPPNPYSVSKLSQEYFCHSYFYTHNLPLVALRFSNAYGPEQKEKNIIWTFIEEASQGKPIVLFGEGTHGRDFTYISDVVQGITKAIDRGRLNEAYHISSESFIRIRDLAQLIADHFPGVGVEHVPFDKAVVVQGFLNVAKARRDLDYEPRVAIKDGITQCVLWYENEHKKGV